MVTSCINTCPPPSSLSIPLASLLILPRPFQALPARIPQLTHAPLDHPTPSRTFLCYSGSLQLVRHDGRSLACWVYNAVCMLVAGETAITGIRPPATSTRFQHRPSSLLSSRDLLNPLSLVLQLSLTRLPLAIRVCVILGQLRPYLRALWRLRRLKAYEAMRLPIRQDRTRPARKMPYSGS
jgi:hypothetical protein